MIEGPLAEYRALLAEGILDKDTVQSQVVMRLQSLYHAISILSQKLEKKTWSSLLGLPAKNHLSLHWSFGDDNREYQGLYLYGDVGSGKSTLMDIFYTTAPIDLKKRVHFHAFMQDVHSTLHLWREKPESQIKKHENPLILLAKTIAEKSLLLCFDELQITDIGDAMIVGTLFEALLKLGVTFVITSNRPPEDLYKNGLQRERFLPFIALIREHLDVQEVSGGRDYRLNRDHDIISYFYPLNENSVWQLQELFDRMTNGQKSQEETLTILGRDLTIPKASGGIAWFDFSQLCQSTLGPSDYLGLASRYHTLFLSNIPRLSAEKRDSAKRFVTLVDALYESHVKLFCSAEASPDLLYLEGDGSFEFHRTVSRLMEMQSNSYLMKNESD